MAGHVPRRSERSHKQSSEQPVSRGGSRSGSTSRSTSQRRCARSIPNVDKSSPRKRKRSPSFYIEEPKFFSRIINGRTVDRFCWLCHKECDSESCTFCPRSYHEDCFRKIKGNCECHRKAVEGENDYMVFRPDVLKLCLEFVLEQSVKEDKKNNQKSQAVNTVFSKNFQTWPPEKSKLLKIIDLDILMDNVVGEEPYKTTGEFFVDVKWIYHNCYIIYGPNHPITETAFKMEKNFKQELIDMEACPQCYILKFSYSENFFTRVCDTPHMIVWAKLRGSPFWPAKCLKISNGHADVRFFGTHDKSNIPINKCYKISKDNPLKNVHQAKYMDAVSELISYVKNYESSHGPFRYYPQKTSLKDCISSAKKFNKKGHHKLNDMKPANQNSDPKELKFRAMGNFLNENVTDPNGVDNDPNVVCQMDFIADEHNEPYFELNNSENNMRFSTSLPVSSLNTDLASFEQAPRILSTGILTTSNELELPPETQNSLNILVNSFPVITSVSTNEMALNEFPANTSAASNDIAANEVSANSSTSSLLPLIASTVSASELFDQENNVNIPMNDTQASSLHLCNNLMRNESFSGILESDNEDDDEVQIVNENGHISLAEQLINNPQIAKAIAGILMGNRPHLKKIAVELQNVIMQYIVIMMVESSFAKFDKNEVKKFFASIKRFTVTINKLKMAVDTANNEKEMEKIAKQEADSRRLLAEQQLVEALNAKTKLEEELKELKRRAIFSASGEIQNHKAELKECIIRKVVEKMQSNNNRNENYFLEQQLNEAKEKLNIKETNISLLNRKNSTLESDLECERETIRKLRENNSTLESDLECARETIRKLTEENERLKSDLSYASGKSNINMCHFGVQTEETHTELEPDSIFDLNSTTDSSELDKDFLENQNETHSISDPSVTQLSMRQTSYIFETLESNNDFSSSVVQQVYEQNSECTSVISAAGAGLMSTAPHPGLMSGAGLMSTGPPPGMMSGAGLMNTAPPHGMMSAAGPTLVRVPMVMQPNTYMSTPGPYILDPQSSVAFLNSINPPDPRPPPEPAQPARPKSKTKSSSAMKYSVKRRKKNV